MLTQLGKEEGEVCKVLRYIVWRKRETCVGEDDDEEEEKGG